MNRRKDWRMSCDVGSWRLEKGACVFIVSIVYSVINNWACRCVGYCDYFRSEVIHYDRNFARKNPTEIHGGLSEVCGEFTAHRGAVSRWAKMEEVWSLWQMLLKKIVVHHVQNFLEAREQKLRRKMHKNRPHLLVAGPIILHDNAHPHIADVCSNANPLHYYVLRIPRKVDSG